MKKVIATLFLIFVLFVPNLSASITDRFPVVRKGNYFTYSKTESSKSIKTSAWQVIEWQYEIKEVYDNGTIIIKVSWRKNTSEGGYITKIHTRNLLYFEVFFDITNIYNATTQLIRFFNNHTIKEIEYNWQGQIFSCINASYYMSESGIKGYFIISKDYGVMFERVQYSFANITTQAISSSFSAMKLTDTNAFGKSEANMTIFVIIIVIIAIPVAWWLLWKKKS